MFAQFEAIGLQPRRRRQAGHEGRHRTSAPSTPRGPSRSTRRRSTTTTGGSSERSITRDRLVHAGAWTARTRSDPATATTSATSGWSPSTHRPAGAPLRGARASRRHRPAVHAVGLLHAEPAMTTVLNPGDCHAFEAAGRRFVYLAPSAAVIAIDDVSAAVLDARGGSSPASRDELVSEPRGPLHRRRRSRKRSTSWRACGRCERRRASRARRPASRCRSRRCRSARW